MNACKIPPNIAARPINTATALYTLLLAKRGWFGYTGRESGEDMGKSFDFIVRTKQDLIDAVQEFGIVPLFENAIPGFSVEEHVVPAAWFGSEQDGVWEWKGPVIRESGCAYGKFFEKKAAFISAEWFPDFANYRRDGYDFDARWDEGLVPHGDKFLYDLIDANGPVLSKLLKRLGEYGKNGRKGFDTAINRLQAQGYVLISDFVYLQDKHGLSYGWGVAEYTTPEKLFGEPFTDSVYRREPEESRARLLAHLRKLLPDAEDAALERFLR